ncbi:MAG: ATP-dependent sacrificial sulfur transferase LarE [Desulfobacterales bacterium]|nr:ATP-dependent sacrificial sulfur transferase LarE [Desulfobacterales bacterium]
MNRDIRRKKEDLISNLKGLGSILVAFSGGVDSAFLLAVAHEALGDHVVSATANSMIHPDRENDLAGSFVRKRGIRHVVFQSGEMGLPDFVSNGADRCYYCKRHMLRALLEIAGKKGIRHVAHGANLDDENDYRPGFRAAREAGVIAPLIDAHMSKEDIRFLSKEMGLSTWDKPSMACLASRIPYGSTITEENLKMVEDAENFLSEQGLGGGRVRHHGTVARIEVDKMELENIMRETVSQAIIKRFRKIGFEHIALDLEGYISGKMNRSLVTHE